MSTLILKCNCKNEFQDKEYGMGNRLFNEDFKYGAKCTVCSTTVKVDGSKKEKKK